MDILSIFTPPSVLTICLVVVTFAVLALKLTGDVREIRKSRRLYQKLVSAGKKSSRKTISVVIELSQSADKLVPLLDDLYKQKYTKLEVVIIIKHTAGRMALSKLKYYRQKNHIKKLKLIKHVKGLGLAEAIKKYSSGYLVVPLATGDRVSKNFLDDISTDSLLSVQEVMSLRTIPGLNNNLTSAMVAHFHIWRTLITGLRSKKVNNIQAGFVYKRQLINDERVHQGFKPYAIRSATVMTAPKVLTAKAYRSQALAAIAQYASKWYVLIALAAGLIGLTALFVVLGAIDSITLVGVVFIVYIITHIGLVAVIKIYSIKDRLNLVLLAPFALIFGIVLVVATPIKGFMDFLISLWPKKLLQKRFNNNN